MADTPMAAERDDLQRHPQMADALQYLDWVKRAYSTEPEARRALNARPQNPHSRKPPIDQGYRRCGAAAPAFCARLPSAEGA